MSDDNSKILMVGALMVGAYLYSRRAMPAQAGAQQRPGYAVGSMPGSAGVGWQQIGVSALTGFLKGMASGVQNSATGYTPSLYNPQQQIVDYSQSGTVQDVYQPEDAASSWA